MSGTGERGQGAIDTLAVLARPWVFTQSHPLRTSDVIDEAKKRGIALDPPTLRELYRRGDLRPIVELTTRAVSKPQPVSAVPAPLSATLATLQRALATGRVRDLASSPYRGQLRFGPARVGEPYGWWNRLIYSRWQLLVLADLGPRLAQKRVFGPYEKRRVVLPPLNAWSAPMRERTARWAVVLTALEAPYLPAVAPEWLRPVAANAEEWFTYRQGFDPIEAAACLGISADEARAHAEQLLSRAHRIDPTGDWSRLIRRALPDSWKTLSGDALVALDFRLAAEILLLFYGDLATKGAAQPLPVPMRTAWGPLPERISDRGDGELDNLLAGFGISPHPGVVLIVEGEVEELLVPRVFDQLGLELAHFSDAELADAMMSIHPTCGGLTRDELILRIAEKRDRKLDVKDVWDQAWAPKPSKKALAEALWPTLAAKIDRARWDPEAAVPQVAGVVQEAYRLAKRAAIGNFVIRAEEDTSV